MAHLFTFSLTLHLHCYFSVISSRPSDTQPSLPPDVLALVAFNPKRIYTAPFHSLPTPPSSSPSVNTMFSGPVPPLNQNTLQTFNVFGNNLTGAIPITPTLLRFGASSFLWNPGLCGVTVNKECNRTKSFFRSNSCSQNFAAHEGGRAEQCRKYPRL
ncbi:hypothetical protein EV2_037232 [Malus domestica]